MSNQEVRSLLLPSHLEGRAFNGEWFSVSESINAVNPATGKILGKIAQMNGDELSEITENAKKAQQYWANMLYADRAQIMLDAAMIAKTNSEEIVKCIMQDSGSIRAKAEFELSVTTKAIMEAAKLPSQPQGDVLPSESGTLSLAKRIPIGVVGVISPFNFPLYLAIRAVAPALALGNSVVLKPNSQTAICGGVVIARIFEEAGLPKGVLSVIPGSIGQAICEDPDVGMIQFTGSTAIGKIVGRTAGENLKKVSLELGGKNALIIREDANLELAVKNATWGAFLHQGQICMASGKILVHRSIVKEFTKKLAEHVENLLCGDPCSETVALGPLINEKQVKNVKRFLAESVKAGAVIETGGTNENLFFRPTVVSGVKPKMALYEEEIFGPVASIISFNTDEQAIEMANDTEYGLSAAIISKDVAKAMAMGEKIHSGLLHINDQTVNDDVIHPFGGVGKSGNGSSIGGVANLDLFTHWRWITIKSEAPAYPL